MDIAIVKLDYIFHKSYKPVSFAPLIAEHVSKILIIVQPVIHKLEVSFLVKLLIQRFKIIIRFVNV